MRTRVLVVSVVVLVVAGLGWFFGVRHGDGPLGDSALGSRLCAPVGESKDATVGNVILRNSSSSSVTITDVSLIGARNAEDGGAILVPGSVASKSGWEFGNVADGVDGVRIAVDAVLAGKSENWMVVHVTRPDVLGESYLAGVRIEYTTGVRRFAFETGPEHVFRPGKCF